MSPSTDPAATRRAGAPPFRLDNDQLAFRFTSTLSDRHGAPVERLPTPARLDDWLAANGLAVGGERATADDLLLAHRLREAIHRVGTAVARGSGPDPTDADLINGLLREEPLTPELTADGMRWRTATGDRVSGALSRIALDAVVLLGGDHRNQVKTCENPDCAGLYRDASRGQNRRWCSMNVCGNRAKKARLRGSPRRTE